MHSVAAGAWLTGSLIVAIGPQNLHVLRTGLVGRHVALTVVLCVAADALLLALALAGGLTALLRQPLVLGALGVAGVLALATMAWRSLREAWRGGDIGSADSAPAVGWRVAGAAGNAAAAGGDQRPDAGRHGRAAAVAAGAGVGGRGGRLIGPARRPGPAGQAATAAGARPRARRRPRAPHRACGSASA